VRAASHRKGARESPAGADDRDSTARMDCYQDMATGYRHVVRLSAHASSAEYAHPSWSDTHQRAAIVVRHPQAAKAEGEVVRLGTGP
jgi:hypothetical protein